MTVRNRFLTCTLLVVWSGACTVPNPNFRGDAGQNACKSSGDCSAPMPACDLAAEQCVQCTVEDASECTGATPFCGANNTCQGCTMHSHCASNACRPDGSCGQENEVAYVDPQKGNGETCSKDAPCSFLATALTKNRPYIKVTGILEENVVLQGFVTILSNPGTQLRALVPGPVVRIANQSMISIYDLEITGAKIADGALEAYGVYVPYLVNSTVNLTRVKITRNAATGVFIDYGTSNVTESTISDNGIGLRAARGTVNISDTTFSNNLNEGLWTSGPETTNVTRSTFRNNRYGIRAAGDGVIGTLKLSQSTITTNREGGVMLLQPSTRVLIENNFIIRNGGPASGLGGIWGFTASSSEIKFNTFADNVSIPNDGAAGIECKTAVDLTNNLFFRNIGGVSNPQFAGSCTNVGSYINNSTANTPGFVQPNAEPYDYHLSTSTPDSIRDKADCGGTNKDFDGDSRPVSGRCDLGADEHTGS